MQTWLLLTCLICAPADVDRSDGGVVAGAGVGRLFVARVSSTIESIPPDVLVQLAGRGWRIEAVESLSAAIPELARQRPRGWPRGWTWANVDAVHLPVQRRVVFAEWRRGLDGRPVPSDRVAGVVRHELGHAWDVAWTGGPYSDTDRFRAAYAADLSTMSVAQRRRLDYFVQATSAGRQETFAELFALHFGGGSAEHDRAALVAAFPRCRQELARLFPGEQRLRTSRLSTAQPIQSD